MKVILIGTAEVGRCDGGIYSSANRPLTAEAYRCYSIRGVASISYCPFVARLDQRVSMLLHAILLLYQREITVLIGLYALVL